MAPPVTKRRKLEHSDAEEESEGSFADFDETNSAEEDGAGGSDVSMDAPEELDAEAAVSDEEEAESSEDEEAPQDANKQAAAAKPASAARPHKRPAPSLQDGVYTAETFKSNMFKLQVDELLEQAKPKYGKKEAPAENAMRTLKTIIEQIPSRDALAVGQ